MTVRKNGMCSHKSFWLLYNTNRPCYVRQFRCFTYCWCSSYDLLVALCWWYPRVWEECPNEGRHTEGRFCTRKKLRGVTPECSLVICCVLSPILLATSMPLLPSRFLRSKPPPQFLHSYGNRSGFSHKVLESKLWVSYFCKCNRSEMAVHWGALPYILSVIKSKQIRCVGHLALFECWRGSRNFSGKPWSEKISRETGT